MLVAIPAVFFLLAWLAAAVRVGLRQGFVVATILATAGVVAATELLSLGAWLRSPGLLAFWGGAVVVVALWLLRRSELQCCRRRLPELWRGAGRAWGVGRLELVGMAVVLGTVLLIGLVSPPNNWESMAYRMVRAVMWVQHGSVAAYATPYIHQIYYPPLGAYQVTHMLSLGSGDWFVHIPAWVALAGCPLAASLLARELKQGMRTQLLAAVVASTLPMALLQGSSTQGNLQAAYWVLCFVLLLAQHLHRPARWRLACCGAAAGFAVLAKPTAYVVVPVAAAALGAYGALACRQPRRTLVALAVAAAIAVGANLGHYTRNWQTFGHPVLPPTGYESLNDRFDLTVLTSNLLRNSLVHWSLPSAAFSESVLKAASAALGGIPEPRAATAGRTLSEAGLPYRINEGETPNFLHHWLLFAAAIGLVMQARRHGAASPRLLNYLLAGWLASIVAFSAVLQWEYWNSRYHVMLFMLGAPLAAVFLSRVLAVRARPQSPSDDWRTRAGALILLIASVPWLLFKENAPLLPSPAADRPTTSIFSRRREEGYFSWLGGRVTYRRHVDLAEQIVALQADEVGLEVGLPWVASTYPLIALVNERRKGTRFAYVGIDGDNPTAALQRPGRPHVLVKAAGRWAWANFDSWRYQRVWTHPDGTALLRRRGPLQVVELDKLDALWSRRLEARVCEAALAPGGAGAFLQDDLLVYVGVRRPLGGERPPVVGLGRVPVAERLFETNQRALGPTRKLRSFPRPTMWERSNDDGTWTVLPNNGASNKVTPRPADIRARLRATTVTDCGGRRWHNTAGPSAPVAPRDGSGEPQPPVRHERPRQMVVRAEFRAPGTPPEGDQRVMRTEVALHFRQVPTFGAAGVVAIRIGPAHLQRLHVTDVGIDGRVRWQQSLPIPARTPRGGE